LCVCLLNTQTMYISWQQNHANDLYLPLFLLVQCKMDCLNLFNYWREVIIFFVCLSLHLLFFILFSKFFFFIIYIYFVESKDEERQKYFKDLFVKAQNINDNNPKFIFYFKFYLIYSNFDNFGQFIFIF
jgi:hypothetical protein